MHTYIYTDIYILSGKLDTSMFDILRFAVRMRR